VSTWGRGGVILNDEVGQGTRPEETPMRALLCVLVLAAMVFGAAPPARPTPEQVKLLRQRPWFVTNEKTLEIELRVFGPWHRQVEKTADRLGDVHQARGEWMQEAKCRRMVLEARRALLGEGHWQTVDARLALAESLAQPGRTDAQRMALSRANELNRQGFALYHKGQAAKAVPLIRACLTIRKEALGERHPDYAQSLHNLAFLYKSMGDHKRALPLYRQAVAIFKEVLGERHPEYANSLNNLASLYQATGDHKQALPLYQKALSIRKEALREKHPEYANSLNNLALLYKDMGEHHRALPLYRQALAIKKEVLGERHFSYAISLDNLAALHQKMGEYRAALPLFQKALAIKKALGEKHPDYATSLNNLANLYKDMGDHKQALPLFKQALVIDKEALGEKHPDYATILNNLALLYQDMGDHKAALPLSQKALAIRKVALGEQHPDCANSLNNLALLYYSMGDHKRALPLYKQALEIYKEVQGEKHPDYARSLNNLALLYRSGGDHKQALPLYQQAVAIYKEVLGERHPEYAISLNGLAQLYEDMGDHKQALPLSEEAVVLTLAHLRDSASVQSDRQQLAAAAAARYRLDLRLSLGDAGGYVHVLAWKGAVLLRQRQRRLFSALSADPRTREAAQQLQEAARQIAALSASSKPAREHLERLTKQQERLQARLSALSAEARAAFRADALTLKALSGALPEGAALVDYLAYWRYLGRGKDGKPTWRRHLVAFVSRKGKPTARIDLGPAERTALAALRWRRLITAGKAASAAGAEVKGLIWSPLEKHLAGATTVLISPDGPLAALPFAALPGKKPGTYLIEDVALAVVPVPAMLPEMLKPVDKAKRLKPSLLVVGDVDYDKAGAMARADKAGDRGAPLGVRRDWGKLPGTSAEVAAVSRSFTKLFKKEGTVTDLDRSKATKAKAREALAKVRYAHLATHGFFAQEDSKSALSSKKADAFFGKEGVTGWHPLLLSGIVLAGANKEPKEGEEDGILTALEVSEMELPKLELVVLSACETGLGKSAGGEGLLGLQRAFAVAGARTVVASMWAVDDRATQALMSEFYRVAWDPDSIVSRAEALRRAQLSLLKEGKRRGIGKKDEKLPKGETRLPPLYWAAFVLSGDWR
jgi:CHAT domain-containing protein/Tfp pilus assembly protein PilF